MDIICLERKSMSLCMNGSGNCLGEEGCEALREVMEEVDKADMLASLR